MKNGFYSWTQLTEQGDLREGTLPKVSKVILCCLFVLGGLLTSCNSDGLDDSGRNDGLPPVPAGYVRTEVKLSVDESREVNTRATDSEEKAYDKNNVWVLVFNMDADPLLMQRPVRASVTGSIPTEQLFAMLRATGEPRQLYVVAGLSPELIRYFDGLTDGDVVTRSDMDIALRASSNGSIVIDGSHYCPMSSEVLNLPTGTAALTQLAVSLQRIVARIDVACVVGNYHMPTADFELEEVVLWNAASQGCVLPQTVLPENLGGLQTYDAATDVVDNALTAQIYAYENNAGVDGRNPTKIIVKGRYMGGKSSYYRLDLLQTEGQKPYRALDIVRNTRYRLVISKVLTDGYRSAAEAAANNAANNIDYSVSVDNGSSTDIVSNGNYYIGSSNSDYVLYGDGDQTAVIATITHNAPSTVALGSIEITNVSGGANDPLVVENPFLGPYDGSVKESDLILYIPTDFVSCDVELRLGTLKKRIRITRNHMLSIQGSVLTNFAIVSSPSFVAAEVEGAVPWIKLSLSSTYDPLTSSSKLTTPFTGGIYVHVLKSNGPMRRGSVYGTRGNDEGHVKLDIVQQKAYILSFDGNGADSGVVPGPMSGDENMQVTLPAGPDKGGFVFLGWNTQADGNGTDYGVGTVFTMPALDVTLYAKWGVRVTYDNSYPTVIMPLDVVLSPNSVYTIPSKPGGRLPSGTRLFDGYYTNPSFSGTLYVQGDQLTVTQNITLYAKFINIPFAVYDTPDKDGNIEGYYNNGGWAEAMGYTNPYPHPTKGLVDPNLTYMKYGGGVMPAPNAQTGCNGYWEVAVDDPTFGIGNWRVPTKAELQLLLDWDSSRPGTITAISRSSNYYSSSESSYDEDLGGWQIIQGPHLWHYSGYGQVIRPHLHKIYTFSTRVRCILKNY